MVGSRHCILLPKLNRRQLRFLRRRLGRDRVEVKESGSMSARCGGAMVHVEPSGYCWSSADPADSILPLVPELLSFPKERTSPRKLTGMYFHVGLEGEVGIARVGARLECFASWETLRRTGGCGLAPDEEEMFSRLVGRTQGPLSMVTDFVSDESVPVVLGRRRYFRSRLSVRETLLTLRGIGTRGTRNSYLPRDGLLELDRTCVQGNRLAELTQDLGEWCYYSAT